MNVALPDGNVVAIPAGASQKDVNDILNAYTNAQLQPSHGATPPASTVPYDEGLLKRGVRGALKVVGGAGAGILATPETFGAGTIPAAMLGYSVGKKAGDVLLGPEPPTAPPAPRQATSMLGSMAEGVTRLPESLPRTAEGLMTFPAQAAQSITDPAARGDIAGTVKAAADIPVGVAKSMAKPTGLMGLENAKDAWAQDFGGSTLAIAGLAKAGAGVANTAKATAKGFVEGYGEGNPGAVDMAKLSAEHDVPVDLGSMTGNVTLKNAATSLEKIPLVGTRAFRANQGGRARAAAERIVEDYTPPQGAPEDPGMATAQSFNRSYQDAKAGVKSAFDVVEQLAATRDTRITPDGFKSAIEEMKSPEAKYSLPDDFLKDPSVKYLLENNDVSFAAARNMRSKLNSLFGKYQKQVGTGAIGEREYAGVSTVLDAFRKDMKDGVMKSDPELSTAYDAANQQHAENVVPYRQAGLKDVIERGGQTKIDSDVLLKKFFQPDRPNLARKFWNQLDDQGRQTVQYAILKNAFDSGLDTKSGEAFSPARFAQEMERLGSTKDVVFSPSERIHLDGFTKLMRATERAGQYGENPPTGQRAIDFMLGGGIIGGAATGHVGAIAAGGTLAWGFSRLLTSQAGRNILADASRLPESSPSFGKVIGRAQLLLKSERDK